MLLSNSVSEARPPSHCQKRERRSEHFRLRVWCERMQFCFSGTQVDVHIFKDNSPELWSYIKAAVANKNAGATVL